MFCPLSTLLRVGRPREQIVAQTNGQAVSFQQFRADVAANITNLSNHNVTEAVLVTADGYQFAVGFMALLHTGCKIILPPNAQAGTLQQISTQGCTLLTDLPDQPIANVLRMVTGHDAVHTFDDLSAEFCEIDFYTSGSTGEPKCISKKLFQIENEIEVLHRYWDTILDGTHVLSTVSHQHIYGLLMTVFWPLSSGRCFFARPFATWEELFEVMTQSSFVVSSPAHLSRFPGSARPAADNLPKLTFSSGGPLALEAAQQCQMILGSLPVEIFGSTETGGVAFRKQEAEDTPWVPFDVVTVRQAGSGELEVRSPYLGADKWYRLADLVKFNANGTFSIEGRADRIAKIEGKRVSLPQLETLLAAHTLVAEATALSIEDVQTTLCAVAVLTDEGRRQLEAEGAFRISRRLRRDLARDLEPAGLPKRWRFVDRIPVNSQGKREYHGLQALFEN